VFFKGRKKVTFTFRRIYEKAKYSASISSMQNIDDIDDGNAGLSAGIWIGVCWL